MKLELTEPQTQQLFKYLSRAVIHGLPEVNEYTILLNEIERQYKVIKVPKDKVKGAN